MTLAVFAADLTDPTAEFDSVNAPVILLLTASFRSQDWIFGGMAPMSNDSTRTRALPSNGVDLSPAERASVGPFPGIRWRFPARPGAPGSADFSLKSTPLGAGLVAFVSFSAARGINFGSVSAASEESNLRNFVSRSEILEIPTKTRPESVAGTTFAAILSQSC